MRMMRRIRADTRNQGHDLPDCVEETSYWCNYMADRDLYLLYRGWSNDSHTKFSHVPVSHDDVLHPLSSLSFSSSTLPSPKNMKLSHRSLSLHAMIKSQHRVQHTPSTAFTKYSIHCGLHRPCTASSQNQLSPAPSLSLCSACCTQFSTFPQLRVNQ